MRQILIMWGVRNFPEALKDRLKVIAVKNKTPLYKVAIEAIRQYVDREEKENENN